MHGKVFIESRIIINRCQKIKFFISLIDIRPALTIKHKTYRIDWWRNDTQVTQQETGMMSSNSKPIRQNSLLDVTRIIVSISLLKIAMQHVHLKTTVPLQGKVLLAEDNPINQQVARAMLEKLGLQITLAANGQEAIELAEKDHFDLILMDIQMPIMDGHTATMKIRQSPDNLRHIPIIALTANAMLSDRQKCLDAGMNDFLSKPFTLAQLQAMLEHWLAVAKHNRHTSDNSGSMHESFTSRDAIINLSTLNRLRELDPENGTGVLKKLISIYLSYAPSYASQIEKAIQAADHLALNKAAHTFKSSAANVGAETLAGICQKLENFGKNNQMDEASKLLPSMQQEFQQVTIALEALLVNNNLQK